MKDLTRRVEALEQSQTDAAATLDPTVREFLDWIQFPNGGPGEPVRTELREAP